MQAFKQFFSRKVALILGQTWPAETGNFCIKKIYITKGRRRQVKKKRGDPIKISFPYHVKLNCEDKFRVNIKTFFNNLTNLN